MDPTTTCNAKTRRGEPCQNEAGFGTDHLGQGRCKIHGGITRTLTHGRYSLIKREAIRDLIAAHEADPDPLDCLPELAASRALFQDFIERYAEYSEALIAWHASFRTGEGPAKPPQILDISDAYRLLDSISKQVERIEKTRAANAVSQADLFRIMGAMGLAVKAHASPEVAARIQSAWDAIRV